jgi:hypothetical protein
MPFEAVWFLAPAGFIGWSLQLISGDLPPKSPFGFRSPKMMASDDLWRIGNKIVGQCFLGAGIVELIGLAIVAFIAPTSYVARVANLLIIAGPAIAASVVAIIRIEKL